MKKNLKLVSVAAAALIAASPIISSVIPVHADTDTAIPINNDIASNPVISYNGMSYGNDTTINLADNAPFNYVPVGNSVNAADIEKAFSSSTGKVDVNMNGVNVDVAGKYLMSVSATNNSGAKTTVSFYLTVGPKNATYQTVQGDTDATATVYQINDNKIAETNKSVNVNTQIATFGTISVDGVSYTRVNSENSNEYIKSSFVDGSFNQENADVASEAKKVMHTAIAYNENGKATSRKYVAFHKVNVEPKKVTINGVKYYKVYNRNDYIKAVNIDGTKRTLKKNAYIYATSTKRASKTLLKKGTKVTTYGGSYKFKDGKRYYRIQGATKNNKRYVKVANF